MIHTVHFLIPPHIEAGLLSGELVRNAAGVVRATSLHPTYASGAIFAHLREVNAPTVATQAGTFLPTAGLVLMQAATFAYTRVRLDRIERTLEQVRDEPRALAKSMDRVRELQYLLVAQGIAEGLELLARYRCGSRMRMLEDAHVQFVRGLGALKQCLLSHSNEALMENAQDVERLLRAAVLGGAGEMACLALHQAPIEERLGALDAHISLWAQLGAKLASDVPGSHRFPTLEMIRAVPSGNPIKVHRRWAAWVVEATEALHSEKIVISRLRHAPRKELAQWDLAVDRGDFATICVVNVQP